MSLVNVKSKKNRIEYTGDFPNGEWYKQEYNKNGKVVYYENSSGFWWKKEYDNNGKEIYWENSDGYWWKKEYDKNGKLTYEEDSDGGIVDNRNTTGFK